MWTIVFFSMLAGGQHFYIPEFRTEALCENARTLILNAGFTNPNRPPSVKTICLRAK